MCFGGAAWHFLLCAYVVFHALVLLRGVSVFFACGHTPLCSPCPCPLVPPHPATPCMRSPTHHSHGPHDAQELGEAHGITFNSLFCLNNMPIKRWADFLVKE